MGWESGTTGVHDYQTGKQRRQVLRKFISSLRDRTPSIGWRVSFPVGQSGFASSRGQRFGGISLGHTASPRRSGHWGPEGVVQTGRLCFNLGLSEQDSECHDFVRRLDIIRGVCRVWFSLRVTTMTNQSDHGTRTGPLYPPPRRIDGPESWTLLIHHGQHLIPFSGTSGSSVTHSPGANLRPATSHEVAPAVINLRFPNLAAFSHGG